MKTLLVTLRPLAPFGTPLVGDTLFGHLCWALRLRLGEQALDRALQGYTAQRPFLVVSDAFPAGYVPRPTLPSTAPEQPPVQPKDRKHERRKRWLPQAGAAHPLQQWLTQACDVTVSCEVTRTQNAINRLTGTTGPGMFAPRQAALIVYEPSTLLDLHIVYDPQRIDADAIAQLLHDVGAVGYGRDATAGLGKFAVESVRETPVPPTARRFMTLAPCAPDPSVLQPQHCHWLPLTRFGRHGGSAALINASAAGADGGPFKRPVLLAATGAVWVTHAAWSQPFFGRGLGGAQQPISAVLPHTVHQGYAPVLPLYGESTV